MQVVYYKIILFKLRNLLAFQTSVIVWTQGCTTCNGTNTILISTTYIHFSITQSNYIMKIHNLCIIVCIVGVDSCTLEVTYSLNDKFNPCILPFKLMIVSVQLQDNVMPVTFLNILRSSCLMWRSNLTYTYNRLSPKFLYFACNKW
jgi:hypothetical protein